ncbi:hypothetical protein H072_10141 [Dactylellina haptotyla CBS 200.50]|uniref:Uncharacterized protein n=1 Tax=Dactylellina haptotyla (strain CBS 200.50) TaxID=1284197 RepID=S8A048_DACHA|nr:hypothetical protein H072_10141 [Dactylellina haptotyla CBS 200.50]
MFGNRRLLSWYSTSELNSTVGMTSKSLSTPSGDTTPVSVSTFEPTITDATSTGSNNGVNGVNSSVSSSSQSATSTRATGPAATPKVSLLILASVVLLTSISVQLCG